MSSVYAEEGTLAHAYGARLLKLRLGESTEAEDAEIREFQHHHTDEMAGHVWNYVNMSWRAYMDAMRRRGEGDVSPELHVEQHLDYGLWVPEGFGTGDTVVVERGRLSIIDLKYGKGVRVMAQDNPQLKLYALGALDIYDYVYDIEEVRLSICQPRLNHYDTWGMSRGALMEWAEGELRQKAKMAWEGKGEPVAGSWCRFCRGKGKCSAHARAQFEIV